MNNDANSTIYDPYIGIDKIEYSNLPLAEYDIDFLRTFPKSKVNIVPSQNSDVGIKQIIINDSKMFHQFIMGNTKSNNGSFISYNFLTLIVSNIRENNLHNATYDEYNRQLYKVMDYLNEKYHISFAPFLFEDIKVNYIEINTTIPLKCNFSDCNRPLTLLFSFLSNHMKKGASHSSVTTKNGRKKIEEETFSKGNDSIAVCFYNKKKQLQELYKQDKSQDFSELPELLRIEYKLKKSKKVKSEFNSYYWHDLNQQKIADYFMKQIHKLKTDFQKWEQSQQKELKKLIKTCKKESTRTWHHNLIHQMMNIEIDTKIPFILSMAQVCAAYKLAVPDKNGNTGRALKTIVKAVEQIPDCVYLQDDLEKVHYIFNMLETAYFNTTNICYRSDEDKNSQKD